MRIAIVFAAIIFAVSIIHTSTPDKYSSIKIFVPDRVTLDKIWKSGIDYEGSRGKVGGWMEFVAGKFELEQLIANGISFSITVDDLSRNYQEQLKLQPREISGFGTGSMGGYYTFAEVLKQLDSMKSQFPGIISQRDSVGRTIERRAIWAVKISDNPDVDETNEAATLYTSLTHAREPAGMMTVLYYMWWLLENYGSDNTATYLVNNRQLYFIPVLNPDGYVYNQTTNPAGGGMWRKNRRNNGSGSYGVDLNRNYGTYEMWDSPNGGSSTNIFSDTYRGISPFSEPETNSIQYFLWLHPISTCLNYHTYSNLLIYPWGYLGRESDDSLTYREFSFDMVKDNRYTSGTDMQTVNYSTRGNSDDYMYGGAMTRTFAMTPEVGTTGFWPYASEILPLAKENLSANIYIASVAGQYVTFKSASTQDANSDGSLSAGESFSLNINLRNKGLWDASEINLSIATNSSDVVLHSSSQLIDYITARSDTSVQFSCTVNPTVEQNKLIDIFLTISSPDGYNKQDTLQFMVGYPITLFSDNGNEGLTHWQNGNTWGITSDAYSQPSSFTDSPNGFYGLSTDNSLTLLNEISLRGFQNAFLKLQTKWGIEPTSDIGKIEITTNNGSTWLPLNSDLMHRTSGFGKQNFSGWGFDGYTPGLDWVEQKINLSQYLNQRIKIRFNMSSDGSENRDGWYLDDIQIIGYASPLQFLTLENSTNSTRKLYFGEIQGASDNLDVWLGEDTLSVKPPIDIFDARWQLSGTNGTQISMRDTLGGLHISNTYTAEIQPGLNGYPIIIRWNKSLFSSGGWHLRDASTHGNQFDINMLWTDSYIIDNSSISSFELVHTIMDTLPISFAGGWQMISVPLLTSSRNKDEILSGMTSSAFRYQGGYEISQTIDMGAGYWIKSDPTIVKPFGVPILQDTISVGSGWWMISGLYCPVDLKYLECNTLPCTGWKYNVGYRSDTTLFPGEAFWIKGPKTIHLSCNTGGSAKMAASENILPYKESSSLTITNAEGFHSTLYFGESMNETDQSSYELPPIPPVGSFDLRFTSHKFVEIFSPDDKLEQKKILLQSSSYPIIIKWNISGTAGVHYQLINKDGTRHTLFNTGSISINNPDNNIFILEKEPLLQTPSRFALHQNYPNPFNPSTTIRFDLPKKSSVTIGLYDILGKELQSLLSEAVYESGSYNLIIDAGSFSSGIYFCKAFIREMESEKIYSSQQKLILLK